jgi:hypothetical protein
MTGLKSGSGDDLWGDDADESDAEQADSGSSREDASEQRRGESASSGAVSGGASSDDGSSTRQPYIVRRAVQDRSVQFERDERLTFFVHDDVVEGERELRSNAEAALGRSVPKFDLREAVYRAALRNEEDVLAELVAMGYSVDD